MLGIQGHPWRIGTFKLYHLQKKLYNYGLSVCTLTQDLRACVAVQAFHCQCVNTCLEDILLLESGLGGDRAGFCHELFLDQEH